MREWKEYKLGDHINVINGYAFKSTNFLDNKSNDALPVIKIKNVANGDVHLNDCQYHKFDSSLNRFTISYGDVLIALTGNHPEAMTQVVGETSKYKLNEKALLNQRVAKIDAKLTLNGNFLYYFLKDENTHEELASKSSGSANQANISKSDIENLTINLPPLPEQNAIAEVLSSLDDKIDLLHRQNKTLDQQAETLFRQWFVEEAEDKWDEKTLSEISIHLKQNIVPAKNPASVFKHYSLPAFDEGKEPKHEIGKDILSGKYQVISNSILISKLNPRIPRIWGLFGYIDEENAICSTEFQVIKPKENKWYSFIYCFLLSNQVTQELTGAASGTSGSHQRVNPQDIFNLSFLKPPEELIKKFDLITTDLFQKIKSNTNQIRTLSQLRETLLPKLISGDVKLSI